MCVCELYTELDIHSLKSFGTDSALTCTRSELTVVTRTSPDDWYTCMAILYYRVWSCLHHVCNTQHTQAPCTVGRILIPACFIVYCTLGAHEPLHIHVLCAYQPHSQTISPPSLVPRPSTWSRNETNPHLQLLTKNQDC